MEICASGTSGVRAVSRREGRREGGVFGKCLVVGDELAVEAGGVEHWDLQSAKERAADAGAEAKAVGDMGRVLTWAICGRLTILARISKILRVAEIHPRSVTFRHTPPVPSPCRSISHVRYRRTHIFLSLASRLDHPFNSVSNIVILANIFRYVLPGFASAWIFGFDGPAAGFGLHAAPFMTKNLFRRAW
ncbi:hypothetical protein A0H81_09105 [Grifola frondosa]|uniref:Uncharacterized protein n=1 Tax=Grifola frondosa TaxID=5627 RepID=A0A1C7M2G1_GRIFR|nr:hypothetical protein A0H81_09105 [Grifola frondosa]